ncbi:ParA family protein [Amycolatopsis rubida]|uniref:Chromosome partitioning protein n=1 Tax=Amycolatopsis rubida TaxID=112413 RepID=A0A1I5ZUK8_9PSEU|nr:MULTISPECIES: ParA family protein [Amycolatopsis]MYW89144.1 AAA family ATPase [Amycolatopsis rubida]NEC54122.1 ParA family protein [Amycolatopsis rubida]OAP24112.1 Sporulation initiation inhibitor protein Soj [Amycolatopsis sp. M39]SFQ60111.1 chromosome partitioning protein [Amycolatopsis rubida]
MQITSVVNQKGGVGKTSLSVGAAAALAERGRRVLLVDLDPQGHATTEMLGLDEVPADAPSLAKALTKLWKGPIEQLAVPHPRSNLGRGGALDVIPTSPGMFDLIRRLDQFRVPGWQLARVIQFAHYDHVIIDCPPAQDVLTNNALAASHGILVPVQPDKTSIRALRLLSEQVRYVEQTTGRAPISWFGIVPGLYRRPISHYAAAALQEMYSFGVPMLSHVPLGVVMNEAAAHGVPVTTFAPETIQAVSFREIAETLDGYLAQNPGPTEVPADDEFVFEDFISEVAVARNVNDNGARKKLYDLMPKRPNRPR